MNWQNFTFSQEPAVWVGLADALVVLAVTFGLPLTAEQKGAIDGVLALVAGVFIRGQVSPVAAVPAPLAPPG